MFLCLENTVWNAKRSTAKLNLEQVGCFPNQHMLMESGFSSISEAFDVSPGILASHTVLLRLEDTVWDDISVLKGSKKAARGSKIVEPTLSHPETT